MEIRFRDGWKIVGNLRIPWGPGIVASLARYFGGAQEAAKQPLLATAVAYPVDLDWDWQQESAEPSSAPETREDAFGRCGLTESEVRWLAGPLGNSRDRVADVLRWTLRAHTFEAGLQLRLNSGLHAAHNAATKEVAKVLGNLHREILDGSASVDNVWSFLNRRFSGTVFPRAGTQRELEELIVCARNVLDWIARRGGFPCKCRAMPELG